MSKVKKCQKNVKKSQNQKISKTSKDVKKKLKKK